MSDRPTVLLSNDDGWGAPGLLAMAAALRAWAKVVVVAPSREQSACSHRISLGQPLRCRSVGEEAYALTGTPVDCVYYALVHPTLLPQTPRLVISGINFGFNLARDVIYSGTVGAAREGAIRGVPSLAVSAAPEADVEVCAKLASELAARYAGSAFPEGQPPLLNLNVPAGAVRGVRATRLGQRDYEDVLVTREDPRGNEYTWIGGPVTHHGQTEGTDTWAVDQGYASVTPLSLDASLPDHLGVAAFVAGPVEP